MNVYDFDKTIYIGDSTVDFYLFCLTKYPKIILYLPTQVRGYIEYKKGKIEKKRFKELFFSFLKGINDVCGMVTIFWDKKQDGIKDWYHQQQKEDDVVISASPRFLLEEICTREGIRNLIATEVDLCSGKFYSDNCYGNEKVKRFKEEFPNVEVECFYSDSKSDSPMAELAQKAFIVKGNKLKSWK